jgi:hypothetical protein
MIHASTFLAIMLPPRFDGSKELLALLAPQSAAISTEIGVKTTTQSPFFLQAWYHFEWTA